MFETDIFGLEAMNRRFMYEFSSSSVPTLNGFVFSNGLTDQNMNTDTLLYDDGFDDGDEDDGTISDCSTSYSYGSDQEGVTGTRYAFQYNKPKVKIILIVSLP